MHISSIPSFNVLGSRISALTHDRAVLLLREAVDRGSPVYVCVCTVHTVVEGLRRPEVQQAVNGAWLATTDGMPLVWWGRAAGNENIERVYGPEVMRSVLLDERHEATRHFFYGGVPGVTEKLVEAATRLNPRVRVAGWITPPFRPLTSDEEDRTVTEINRSNADIVWVGLGCPKQDLWMARLRDRLAPPVLIGVGAAFDFLAGVKRQAPPWMRNAGLEWFHRLASEPGRLWRRYLVYNALFLGHTAAHLTGLRRYPLEDRQGGEDAGRGTGR